MLIELTDRYGCVVLVRAEEILDARVLAYNEDSAGLTKIRYRTDVERHIIVFERPSQIYAMLAV